MTKLELMICEAENNGEIDLDTRDQMLGILNESTRYGREATSIIKRLETLDAKSSKLYDITRRLEEEGKNNAARKSQEQLDKVEEEIATLKKKLKKVDPSVSVVDHGGYKSIETSLTVGKGAKVDDYDGRRLGKNLTKHSNFRNYKEDNRKSGMYKTCKGLKESVLEEIYEAELCGDITSEERAALIDYMED